MFLLYIVIIKINIKKYLKLFMSLEYLVKGNELELTKSLIESNLL